MKLQRSFRSHLQRSRRRGRTSSSRRKLINLRVRHSISRSKSSTRTTAGCWGSMSIRSREVPSSRSNIPSLNSTKYFQNRILKSSCTWKVTAHLLIKPKEVYRKGKLSMKKNVLKPRKKLNRRRYLFN